MHNNNNMTYYGYYGIILNIIIIIKLISHINNIDNSIHCSSTVILGNLSKNKYYVDYGLVGVTKGQFIPELSLCNTPSRMLRIANKYLNFYIVKLGPYAFLFRPWILLEN